MKLLNAQNASGSIRYMMQSEYAGAMLQEWEGSRMKIVRGHWFWLLQSLVDLESLKMNKGIISTVKDYGDLCYKQGKASDRDAMMFMELEHEIKDRLEQIELELELCTRSNTRTSTENT